MSSANVGETSDSTFDTDVLKSQGLAMVDFWAEWCGPCRMLAPTIEGLAGQYSGKVKVYKMNVDQNPDTPVKYSVRGIPTVILFRNGQVVDQLVGNQPKAAFVEAIDRNLA